MAVLDFTTGFYVEPSPGVTFDPVTMKLEVYTRDFQTEGHYYV